MSTGGLKISVIIPVHNGEKYLDKAIQSILNQKHPALEILVIDNASTDSTADIARAYPAVRYFYLNEKGLPKALNQGVEQSKGLFLTFLDADDLWKEGKLDIQLQTFRDDHELDMVFGHIEQFVSPDLPREKREQLSIRDKLLPGFAKTTLMIKRKSFLRVGLFDSSIVVSEFLEWYMRAKDMNLRMTLLPQVLARRRIHTNNMGFSERENRIDYVRVLKQGLDRRRRQGKT